MTTPFRKQMGFLFVFYLAFVVYGSLVPLDFTPVEWSQAVRRYSEIPFLDLGIGSRADWVANLLLFIPLSFLCAAIIWPLSPVGRWLAAAGIVFACVLLSFAIEFVQIFFPPRTVSQNDILAESLGGLIGVLVWWKWGDAFSAWWVGWREARGPMGVADRLYWGYLALVFAYALLPLDLTISPVEIYRKWAEGRVFLLPLAGMPSEPVGLLYALVSDVVIWIPIGALGVLRGGIPRRVVASVFIFAFALELAQLFVYTRVSDVTDLFTAVIGGALGVWIASQFKPPTSQRPSNGHYPVWPVVAGLAGWIGLLALVFWYPFDFVIDRARFSARLDMLFQAPFESYYFGTEYRAATQVLQRVGFFMPLGLAAAWLRWMLGHRGRIVALDILVLFLLGGVPIAIELGQLLLPGKYPSSTDIGIAWFGIAAGYLGLLAIARRWNDTVPRSRAPGAGIYAQLDHRSVAAKSRPTGSIGELPRTWFGLQASIMLSIWLIPFVPGVPYNVKELLGGSLVFLVGTALMLLGNGLAFGTAMLGGWLAEHNQRHYWLWPARLLALAAVSALVFLVVAPLESIHDVVGTPVWAIGAYVELFVRLTALLSWPLTLMVGAAAVLNSLRLTDAGAVVRWSVPALAVLILVHLVVVHAAATDNLTELMAGGGSARSTIVLSLAVLSVFFAAALLAFSFAEQRGYVLALAGLGLFAGLSWVLFLGGAEASIEKYGRSFSALQFLLGADRSEYPEMAALALRYLASYLAVVSAIAIAQYPYWWLACRRRGPFARDSR